MQTMKVIALAAAVAIGGVVAAPAGAQTVVYSNDFTIAAGPEWAPSTATFTLPAGERMLGNPFGNITESLTLTGLPPHTSITISFDLYILLTWDGNGERGFGPDSWTADVTGGPVLQPVTTFAQPGCSGDQSYPDPWPAVYPPTTGAVAVGSLGYGMSCLGDSTYHFEFTFPHSASSITFNFTASGLQGWADEGWGLDNVEVSLPNRPPDCTEAWASPSTLWPPNHEHAPVTIAGVTDPDGDDVTITPTGVMQDEPVLVPAIGAGNTTPDAVLDPLQVRAERAGTGDGRVYHVSFTGDDGRGGTCDGEVLLGVPHDQRGDPAVDGGPLYDSTGG